MVDGVTGAATVPCGEPAAIEPTPEACAAPDAVPVLELLDAFDVTAVLAALGVITGVVSTAAGAAGTTEATGATGAAGGALAVTATGGTTGKGAAGGGDGTGGVVAVGGFVGAGSGKTSSRLRTTAGVTGLTAGAMATSLVGKGCAWAARAADVANAAVNTAGSGFVATTARGGAVCTL